MVGLYIHSPFCLKKCSYCNYMTRVYREERAEPFIQALKEEIQLIATEHGPLPLKTIYLGGGTPSLLSLKQLSSLFSCLDSSFDLTSVEEITLEMNPKGITKEYLLGLRELGVNRLSLGIQSFAPSLLSLLGREHSPREGEETFQLAREAGFHTINVDLIFAIPGQRMKDWEETLERAVRLSPEHLSLYNLQVEEGTRLHQWVKDGSIEVIREEMDYAMYTLGISYLKERKYEHYEISNFSLPGRRGLHNLLYWKNRDYIGLGPGAYGHYGGERYGNSSSLREYYERVKRGERPVSYRHRPSLKERLEESMFLGLRLLEEGVSCREVEEILGIDPFYCYREEIEDLEKKRLVKIRGESLALTKRGLMIANQVMAAFLKEELGAETT